MNLTARTYLVTFYVNGRRFSEEIQAPSKAAARREIEAGRERVVTIVGVKLVEV